MVHRAYVWYDADWRPNAAASLGREIGHRVWNVDFFNPRVPLRYHVLRWNRRGSFIHSLEATLDSTEN